MLKTLRQAPPELYLYFVVPLAGLILITLNNPYFFTPALAGQKDLFNIVFWDMFFSLSVIPLFIIYALFKFFVNLYRYLELRLGLAAAEKGTIDFTAIREDISSSFFLSIGFMFTWFVIGLLVVALETNAPRAQTIENTLYLMDLDYRIFGTYPSFVIQQYFGPFWEFLTIDAYRRLPSAIVIVFFLTLFKSGLVFRKYLLNIILVMLPGLVCWYLLPALSAEEMFRRNILDVPLSRLAAPDILNQLYLSDRLAQFLHRIASTWSNLEAGRLAITSFPSMHLAWGLIVSFYAIKAWPRTVWIFAPYCFFNSIGTVYTLQHFVVDLVPGVLFAGLSILATEKLVEWDLKRNFPRGAYFRFADSVRLDFRRYFEFVFRRVKPKKGDKKAG